MLPLTKPMEKYLNVLLLYQKIHLSLVNNKDKSYVVKIPQDVYAYQSEVCALAPTCIRTRAQLKSYPKRAPFMVDSPMRK